MLKNSWEGRNLAFIGDKELYSWHRQTQTTQNSTEIVLLVNDASFDKSSGPYGAEWCCDEGRGDGEDGYGHCVEECGT